MNKLRVGLFASGGGTTLAAVLKACRDGRLRRVSPALVVSSRTGVGCITKAQEGGVGTGDICVLRPSNFGSSEEYGEAILGVCRSREVELIMMCGFIPFMPVVVLEKITVLNQHPGPLDGSRPGFGGKGMQGRAVHAAVLHFAKYVDREFSTEATVHRVTPIVDGGELVAVQPVETLKDDTVDSLQARVLPHEHQLVIGVLHAASEFGGVPFITRKNPLIAEDEKSLLAEAIAEGAKLYPRG